MTDIDTCVVGGGVVGLAIARELSAGGAEVMVLEGAGHYGQGISSRNSEVVHAGLYYDPASLKSRLCRRGKQLLYQYCVERKISYRRCGKLVVSTSPAEEDVLQALYQKAEVNGVEGLAFLSAAQIKKCEPAVSATSAFLSPATGIVSAHELMDALVADLQQQGGLVALNTRVESVSRSNAGFTVKTVSGGEDFEFNCRQFINAAGLGAQQLAAACEFVLPASVPKLYLCKGSYFSYAGKSPFHRLIYPVPEQSGAGLGVHCTLDLGGQLKFGPNVEYLDDVQLDGPQIADSHYQVDEKLLSEYFTAIRRYFPELDKSRLLPGYVGIRPKLQGPQDSVKDFDIQGPASHGLAGFVQLFGIESPGLTASLAIGEYVSCLLQDGY